MKKNKGVILALVALIAVAATFLGIYSASRNAAEEKARKANEEKGKANEEKAQNAENGEEGFVGKTLTIQIIHGNGETKEFTIQTDAEYLGDALLEHAELGVFGENGPYGLYIKEVDGEEASDANHTYWCVKQNGVDLMVGADQQFIVDGEHYELVLTKW